MTLKLRLSSGEVLDVLAGGMDPKIAEKFDAMVRAAKPLAEPRQTVPPNMRIVFTVGEELGFWTILEMTPEEIVEGRRY